MAKKKPKYDHPIPDLQQEYFEALFEQNPAAMVSVDMDGNVVRWNPAAEELFGYSQKEAVGRYVDDLVANHDSVREEATNFTAELTSLHATRWQSITKRTRKDGSLVDVEIIGVPVFVEDKPVGGIAIYYDITQQKALEEELRERKEYFESLFVNNPLAVVTIDTQAKVISWNPAAEALFGYSREEAVGQNVDDLVAANESIREEAVGYTDLFLEDPVKYYSKYGRLGITTKRSRKDGSLFDVEVLGLPVVVGEEHIGFIVIYHNISERKEYEEELQRQKEYYESLFLNTPAAVITVDREAAIISWNPAAERLFGYTQQEVIGKNADTLISNPGPSREEAQELSRRLTSPPFELVHVFTKRVRKDGSFVDVEAWGVPIIIGDRHLGFIALYNDISELKQIEEELRRQKEYYEIMLVNTPVAVTTGDENGVIISWNQAAEKLFGYSQEEALGQNLDDLIAKDESIREEAIGYTQQTINMQRVHAITKRTRKDGTFVEVELMSVPVILSGDIIGYIALYHNVGEIQEARRAAEAANKAKSDFLARMSHELRTPLNAIIGFTRLVKRKGAEALPEKQVENLDKVLVSADHLLALINDILDLSKIEAGAMDVKPTSFRIESLIDLCLTTTQPLVKSEAVKLQKKIAKGLPQIISDENKVRQILLNLLSNAVKFTNEGSITLKASLKDGLMSLSVTDTGIGISDEALEGIFEEFQQVDMSTTREHGGTGLGLSISQHLAHLLGGEIAAKSVEGKGSTFTLSLPLQYTAKKEEN
jgi:PAS domain S-box-containing protein